MESTNRKIREIQIKRERDCDANPNISNEEFCCVAAPSEEEVGEYYFESDSLALKGNKDYQLLIKTLVQLEAQRAQSAKNLEILKESKKRALNNPLELVQAIQNGEDLALPHPIQITEIPDIDWEKYNIQTIARSMRPTTRKNLNDSVSVKIEEDENESKTKGMDTSHTTSGSYQHWSKEEQRKLEELLIKYPDERIASRRWRKIADELGTRSPLQVQSRVQKFFISLKRRGLPIPGREPTSFIMRQAGRGRKRGSHSSRQSRSMFMEVYEFESTDEPPQTDPEPSSTSTYNSAMDISDEEDISDSLRSSEEYQQLLKLKKLRKLKTEEAETGAVVHYGYECDSCGATPIEGTRWHCVDCLPNNSTDLCYLCIKSNVEKNGHLSSHSLKPIKCLSLKDTLTAL